MIRGRTKRQAAYFLLMLAVIHLLCACTGPMARENGNKNGAPVGEGPVVSEDGEHQPLATPLPDPIPPGVEPNEVGQVMILMYHQIGEPEGEWTRTPANFRQDLLRLYQEGYRLISLNDFLANNIKTPAGFSPVIITFDDGTQGQFNYIDDGDTIEIDPNSAVAILEEFYHEHPDFGLAATFYIYYGNPFGQSEYREKKLRYLVEKGFEIGNHSHGHVNLAKLNTKDVERELALHNKKTQEYLPGYKVRSLALPYGASPKDCDSLMAGQYEGYAYHNDGILLVGAEPAPAPNGLKYNPHRLPRIRADGEQLEKWLTYFANNPGERYISDGHPDIISVPSAREDLVDKKSLGAKELRIY